MRSGTTSLLDRLRTTRRELDGAIAMIEGKQLAELPGERKPARTLGAHSSHRPELGGPSAAVGDGCGGTGIIAVIEALASGDSESPAGG
ncbi:MAG: hypothetical protein ACR2NV_06185 [Thermoleophilaceae bacterium]